MTEHISPAYRELMRQTHAEDDQWGSSASRCLGDVEFLASDHGEVLDYGCGKGVLLKGLRDRGISARGYDPGMPEFDARPEPAGMVACIDVLEHIEPESLDAVLADIRSLAPVAYLSIALLPARKILPDGRNAHLIVKPADWWLQKLQAVFGKVATWSVNHIWLTVVARREPS